MLAIIPARSGSKGLPGKNTMLLNGKPLLAYTIEAALQAKSVTKVLVSTDSEGIADEAKKYGAWCPFLRPSYLATDESRAIDTYIFTLQKLQDEYQVNVQEFMVLQPTSPLRTSADIEAAVKLFKQKNADSVISYTEEQHPVFWHKFLKEDNRFEDIFSENLSNRQELRKSLYPNGSIYIFKKDLILNGHYYSNDSFAYIMPRNRSVDIDTIEDFKLAEFYLNFM